MLRHYLKMRLPCEDCSEEGKAHSFISESDLFYAINIEGADLISLNLHQCSVGETSGHGLMVRNKVFVFLSASLPLLPAGRAVAVPIQPGDPASCQARRGPCAEAPPPAQRPRPLSTCWCELPICGDEGPLLSHLKQQTRQVQELTVGHWSPCGAPWAKVKRSAGRPSSLRPWGNLVPRLSASGYCLPFPSAGFQAGSSRSRPGHRKTPGPCLLLLLFLP